MAYYINPKNLTSVFYVPNCVSDEHLKLSTHLQLKVLLCFLRNSSNNVDEKTISDMLSLPLTEVEDALNYWTKLGVLMSDVQTTTSTTPDISVVRNEKPSRADVIKRGNSDERVAFLLREAQIKFGRNLKSNESSCLLWLYDDLGLDVSVILLAIQFAATEGKANISFIEKTAVNWANKGVENIVDAEREIAEFAKQKTAWNLVMSVFGIEMRKPSDKELTFSQKWINEWKMSKDLLKSAYNTCIDANGKLSMAYINKILENWHKCGVKNPDEIEAKTKKDKAPKKTTNGATYNLELFEQMINSDD